LDRRDEKPSVPPDRAADGRRGFPEVIETVFPRTNLQLCIAHNILEKLAA